MSIVVPSRYFCSIFETIIIGSDRRSDPNTMLFEKCLLNEMYATNIMYSVTEDKFS